METRKNEVEGAKEGESTEVARPSETTYMRKSSRAESRMIMVDDHVLKFNTFDLMKEKDGVRLPH